MPHILRFSREVEDRLERLLQGTDLSKAELIDHCLGRGLAELEAELLLEGADARLEPANGPTIDQLLRESGLGA